MNDTRVQPDTVAVRRPQRGISPVWIVPIAALLVGLWLLYQNLQARGPLVTLVLPDAEGIEAGTTLIKLRNVDIGRVELVQLSDDFSQTLITARMSPDTEGLLLADTQFWVVKPRIGLGGISGLGTVLSGAYIQLLPGRGTVAARRFDVLQQPPVTPGDSSGLHLSLISELATRLRAGDPVSYHGLTVGRVERAEYDSTTRRMQHRLYIEQPYASLITEHTRFWPGNAIDLQMDSEGIRLNVDSLEALLAGGVTFGYLEGLGDGEPAPDESVFTLYPDQDSALQDSFSQSIEYVLLIENTMRGLSAGAPVEYRGVRVGTVVEAPWNFTAQGSDLQLAIPVLIRIEPQRLAGNAAGDLSLAEWEERFELLFAQGLRASLRTGNLLTGALFVDLDLQADQAGRYVARRHADLPVFPVSGSNLARIESQVVALLDKLNSMEVEPVLQRIDTTLQRSDAALAQFTTLAGELQSLLAAPATQSLPESLDTTLAEVRSVLQGFAPGSSTQQELDRSLIQLNGVLRDLQPLLRTLDEQPNALIFKPAPTPDPEPRAATP